MNIFRKHYIALIFSFIVGVCSVLPQVLLVYTLGSEYKGVQFLYIDDEDIYRARIHEILDGHPAVAAPMLYEYKNDPMVMPPINEFVYALPAYVFGLSAVITVSKFLLPALLFFLVYLFVRKLLGDKKEAMLSGVTAGLLVTLGYDLVDWQTILHTVQNGNHTTHFLVWTRLVNPIIGGLATFAFVLSLWFLVFHKYRYAYVVSGILLATTAGYFFSLGISLSILAALIFLFVYSKEFVLARELIYVLLISFVCDAFYWYNTLHSIGGTAGREIAERNGMYFTHSPVVNKFLLVASLAVAISFIFDRYIKKQRENVKEWQFVTALLLGSWIAFNEQVLTGTEIWYHHFVQYVIPLCYISCIAALHLVWRKYFPKLWSVSLYLLCAMSVIWGGMTAVSAANNIPNFMRLQRYQEVFALLNSSPKDCVVLIKENNEELERLIPAYTHCNVYTTTSTFFGISKERILHNYFLRLRLNGITPENIGMYLDAHEDDVRIYFFSNWDQMFGRGNDASWIAAKKAFLVQKYPGFYAKDLKAEIQAYRMDYLLSEHPLPPSLLGLLSGLELRATTTDRYFYSF